MMPPISPRTLPSHPALFVASGLGLTYLMTQSWQRQWLPNAIVALVLGVSGTLMFYDYFIRFPRQTEVYYYYDVDKLDALNYLASLTDGNTVFLSRLWAGHASVTFLRGPYGIKSIDTSSTVVLPPLGQGLIYAFPPEQRERTAAMTALWPDAHVEAVPDPHGQVLLYVVQVADPVVKETGWPASLQPTQITMAQFDDGPTLLGMSTEPHNMAFTLFLAR